jgi:hypothetical protein
MKPETSSSAEVLQLEMPKRPEPTPKQDQNSSLVVLLNFWVEVLNARLLAFLALLGAVFMWAFTAYDPTQLRILAASLYSLVLWPIVYLYAKKGE